MQYTVGMNREGRSDQVAVDADDALAAALRVKERFPDAMITYVRKRNERGDRRHPHLDVSEAKRSARRPLRSPGQEAHPAPKAE